MGQSVPVGPRRRLQLLPPLADALGRSQGHGEGTMILKKGDKILAAHRRLFEGDQPRFFTGEVEEMQGDIFAATGHSWLWGVREGAMVRKNDVRTKILSLGSGTLIVYRLPWNVEIALLKLETGIGSQAVLTDGDRFHMDVSESVRATD